MSMFNMFRQKDGKAIGALCSTLFDTSFSISDNLVDNLEDSTEKEVERKKTHLLFEFTYFFLHMIDRTAYSKLNNERRGIFVELVSAITINHILNVHLKDGPQKVKDKLEKLFWEKSYEASVDYANCNEFISEENPFSSDEALFSKLAKRVSILLGEGHCNPVTLKYLVQVSSGMWTDMNFEKFINAATKDKLIQEVINQQH